MLGDYISPKPFDTNYAKVDKEIIRVDTTVGYIKPQKEIDALNGQTTEIIVRGLTKIFVNSHTV